MNEHGIKQFLSGRVPLSGHLSDYALLIGQNNLVLQTIPTQFIVTGSIGPRPNRVALAISVTTSIASLTAAQRVLVSFVDDSGAVSFSHILWIKEADVALVTPSPIAYWPLFIDVLTFGKALQQTINILITGVGQVNVLETLMQPSCCEYIGGMERTGWPQSAFDTKSNEPLER